MLGATWKPIFALQGEDRSPKPTLSVVLVFLAASTSAIKESRFTEEGYLHFEFTPVVAILVPNQPHARYLLSSAELGHETAATTGITRFENTPFGRFTPKPDL